MQYPLRLYPLRGHDCGRASRYKLYPFLCVLTPLIVVVLVVVLVVTSAVMITANIAAKTTAELFYGGVRFGVVLSDI